VRKPRDNGGMTTLFRSAQDEIKNIGAQCLSLIEAESQMSSMVMDRLALVGAVPAVKWIEIATLFEGSEPLPLCPILKPTRPCFRRSRRRAAARATKPLMTVTVSPDADFVSADAGTVSRSPSDLKPDRPPGRIRIQVRDQARRHRKIDKAVPF
jgi:hypothetical protein